MIMVLELFVKTSATAQVEEAREETITTEKTLTTKLDTEDAQIHTLISCNAESMVVQTTMIEVLMLM
jgi:hypothetical protein